MIAHLLGGGPLDGEALFITTPYALLETPGPIAPGVFAALRYERVAVDPDGMIATYRYVIPELVTE